MVCSILLSYILLKLPVQTQVLTHIGFRKRDENYYGGVSGGEIKMKRKLTVYIDTEPEN